MKRQSTCPIYRVPVIFCDDRDEMDNIAARLAAKAGGDYEFEAGRGSSGGFVAELGGKLLFGLFSPDLDFLAHEAVHAASKTLEMRDIKGDPSDGHEHLTYLVEWYFNEWIRKMGWKVTVRVAKR